MRTSRGWWSLAGLVTGALGLAVSYLVGSLLAVRSAPLIAVAEGVIELTPGPVTSWAIRTFGGNDKSVLVAGILVFLVICFALLGLAARSHWWATVAGYLGLAVIGGVAVSAKPAAATVDFAPLVAGLVTWMAAITGLAELLRRWELVDASEATHDDPTHPRRWFLGVLGGLGAGAALAGLLGRFAGNLRGAVEEARDLLRLENVTAPRVPAGVSVGVEGVEPWRTAAEDFYLIDTAIVKPTILPADWELRIHGMVDRELRIRYDDLIAREITEDWITLNCVSNPVGGDLIGNAWWSGVRLAAVLAEAGPHADADAVLQTSEDGWTCSTPLAALMDERHAMLAIAMNGEPLPIEHGFPVRTIVPGLYGYVSACKWVVDIEVTRFDDVVAFWTDKGWSEMGPVKLASRIDVPGAGDQVPSGAVVCAGSAWHQQTGIEVVEVSLDGAAWQPATLARVPSVDTWVQWRAELDVGEGDHELRVRATDSAGEVQTSVVTGVHPDGATGWHTVAFTAS